MGGVELPLNVAVCHLPWLGVDRCILFDFNKIRSLGYGKSVERSLSIEEQPLSIQNKEQNALKSSRLILLSQRYIPSILCIK